MRTRGDPFRVFLLAKFLAKMALRSSPSSPDRQASAWQVQTLSKVCSLEALYRKYSWAMTLYKVYLVDHDYARVAQRHVSALGDGA